MAVIEVVTFRLGPGADEDRFIEADHAVQTECIYHQPGIVRRTTARHGEDWLAVTVWGSTADADAAADVCRHDPAVARWSALVDPTSVVTARYSTLD